MFTNTLVTKNLTGTRIGSGITEDKNKDNVNKRERIVIDLSHEALKLLDELQIRTGSSTRAELFRNILRFCAAFMDEIDEGSTVLLTDRAGQTYKFNLHKVLFPRSALEMSNSAPRR